jgi:hypothetical protein
MESRSFDIDGVIYVGHTIPGLRPGMMDVIITGRSYEEKTETLAMLEHMGIYAPVYFNPRGYEEKTRESSGQHKAATIRKLRDNGTNIVFHVEDDPIQAEIIQKAVPEIIVFLFTPQSGIPVVNLENQRHDWNNV